MKRMHKQVVSLSDHWQPIAGVPLHVGKQDGNLTVWFEAHDKPIGGLHVKVFGTGHEIPERANYVGTVQADFGLVWHLYSMRD